MSPEGGCPVSSDFKEEMWGDRFDGLDKMLADEEAADNEVGTCADPSLWVGVVSVIKIEVLVLLRIKFPLTFERLPPCG